MLWHRFVNSTGDAHTAGLGQLLDPLGKNDPRSGDRIVSDHHFAETDANPQLRPQVIFEPDVAFLVLYLERERGRDARPTP